MTPNQLRTSIQIDRLFSHAYNFDDFVYNALQGKPSNNDEKSLAKWRKFTVAIDRLRSVVTTDELVNMMVTGDDDEHNE